MSLASAANIWSFSCIAPIHLYLLPITNKNTILYPTQGAHFSELKSRVRRELGVLFLTPQGSPKQLPRRPSGLTERIVNFTGIKMHLLAKKKVYSLKIPF